MSTEKQKADELRRRLDAGWEQIHRAEDRGVDTRTWEEFWLDMLRDYEDAVRRICRPLEHEDQP